MQNCTINTTGLNRKNEIRDSTLKIFVYDTQKSKNLIEMVAPFVFVQWSRYTQIPQ